MSTGQATSNKATFKRFCDAINSGDSDVISKTSTSSSSRTR